MASNWFERWILEPLLASPAVILDPFTLYCGLLGDEGHEGLTPDEGNAAELGESLQERAAS